MMRLAAPGVAHMAGYRLYFMDRFSGHIDNSREFVADDDSQALGSRTARSIVDAFNP